MARSRGPEKQIEMEILGFLRSIGVFCWKTDRQGTYDPIRKTFRKNFNPYKIKGVSDILGMFNGRFLAIEVKAPGGVVTKEQKEFLNNINTQGGLGFVARSVDSVKLKFKEEFGGQGETSTGHSPGASASKGMEREA